jgi:type II secretory pathway component PulF
VADAALVPASERHVIAADLPDGWVVTEATFGTVFERPTTNAFRPNVVVAQESTTVSLVEASSGMMAAAIAAHPGTRVLEVRRQEHALGLSARLLFGYPLGEDWIIVDQRVITMGDTAVHLTASASVLEWTAVEPLLSGVMDSVRLVDVQEGTSR